MPVVDLETKKIIGCDKESLTYYHEQGHLEFANTEKAILYDYSSTAFLFFGFILLALNQFLNNLWLKFVISGLAVAIIYCYVYEEVWCWSYAIKKSRLKNASKL